MKVTFNIAEEVCWNKWNIEVQYVGVRETKIKRYG